MIFCAPIFPLRTALKYSFEKHRKSSDADPFSSVLLIKQQAQQFAEQTSFYLWLSIPGILVTIAVAFWVIVSWHRFILLEDSTHFLLPKFHGRQILSYMWRVILIVLLFIPIYLAYFALALIFVDVSQFNFTALSLLAFASTCIYYVLLYRLSPILPAAALGNKLSFGEAIKATKGTTFSFVVLGFSLAILSILFSFAELLFIHSPTVIAIGVQILFAWLIFIINLSIITTIYGHYVEGRPLRSAFHPCLRRNLAPQQKDE